MLSSLEAIQDVRNEVEVLHHLAGHPNVVNLEQVGVHDGGQGEQGAAAGAAGAGLREGLGPWAVTAADRCVRSLAVVLDSGQLGVLALTAADNLQPSVLCRCTRTSRTCAW